MTDKAPVCGQTPIMWGRMPYPHPGENLGTGNRCGHNPNRPEFHLFNEPGWGASVPHVMRKLIEAVKGYYYAPLSTLPSLANLSGRRNKSGDPRKNRSEARAAEVLVMRAILYFTEYASLRVGTPQADGRFIPRSCVELARAAGMLKHKTDSSEPDEPSPRFWRAFRRLRLAGAFDVYLQYAEKDDGSKRARPAIKRLNLNFLIALGAVSYEQLKRFRSYCSNGLTKARKAYRETFPLDGDASAARDALRREQGERGVHTFSEGKRREKAMKDPRPEAEYFAAARDHHAQLRKQHPDLSAPQVARMAVRSFPSLSDWRRDQQHE